MNKTVLTVFASILVVISFLDISHPTNTFEWLLTATPAFDAVRTLLAGFLVTYMFIPSLWHSRTQRTLMAVGGFLLAIGVIGIFSPNYLGTLSFNIRPLDILTFLEGGVVSMLVAMETDLGDGEAEETKEFGFGNAVALKDEEELPSTRKISRPAH